MWNTTRKRWLLLPLRIYCREKRTKMQDFWGPSRVWLSEWDRSLALTGTRLKEPLFAKNPVFSPLRCCKLWKTGVGTKQTADVSDITRNHQVLRHVTVLAMNDHRKDNLLYSDTFLIYCPQQDLRDHTSIIHFWARELPTTNDSKKEKEHNLIHVNLTLNYTEVI